MACQADWDNHANQLNPNHPEYWHSREQPSDDETQDDDYHSSSSDDDDYNTRAIPSDSQEEWTLSRIARRIKCFQPRSNLTRLEEEGRQDEMVHLIQPSKVRYGVKYENTYCVYVNTSIDGNDILLPNTIPKRKMRSVYDGHMDSPVFAFELPEETIEAETVKVQQWWRFVRRWPEKQKADACMIKAMKMRTNIDKNQKRISELNKELRNLYADDAKLQKKCHEAFGGAIHYYRRLCPEYPYGYDHFGLDNGICSMKDIVKVLTEFESGENVATMYKHHVRGFASWSAEFTNRWLQRKIIDYSGKWGFEK